MKAAVEHLQQDFAFSERRACGILQLPVSTFRYRSSRCDAELRDKLIELAREKPRLGYRRLHILFATRWRTSQPQTGLARVPRGGTVCKT